MPGPKFGYGVQRSKYRMHHSWSKSRTILVKSIIRDQKLEYIFHGQKLGRIISGQKLGRIISG